MKEKRAMNAKRVLCGIIIVLLILAAAPIAALAAEYAVADGQTLDLGTGQLTLTEGGTLIDTYTISEGDTINIAPGANAKITGGANVLIACGAGVTLALENAASDMSATADACALSFTGGGNILKLSGTNNLKSGANEPGVRVEEGTALEISGSGTLYATGGMYSAGIGGGTNNGGGTITISGGTVYATGGDGSTTNGGCAGIGGGQNGKCGTFTMTGGTVYAKSAYGGAGIGSGSGPSEGMDFGVINISGGTVVAEGYGNGGAGIGGGRYGYGTINITGGTVTATGESYGAGIGGGEYADGGTINISGGTITAISDDNGAGIGGGDDGGAGNITIKGDADITAKSTEWGAGIGSGDEGPAGGTVNISGDVKITATGGNDSAGIGGGWGSGGPAITISGGTVTAIGGDDSAGIGGGYQSTGGSLSITGGTVYAIKSDAGSYDIGQGVEGSYGAVSITGESSVLLGTDSINPQPAPAHTHYTFSQPTTDAYGIPVPAGWTPPFGAYLVLYEVHYDANGGSGSAPPPDEKAARAKAEAKANPFAYAEHDFTGWNTKADGSGEEIMPGETFTVTGDMTLFAQWYAPVQSVTLDKHSIIMATGATYRLTATLIPEGSGADINWTSSNEDIATVEGGVVKAARAGGAIITAVAEGKADTCTVIVSGPRPDPTPTPVPTPTPAPTSSPTVTVRTEKTEVIIEKEVSAPPSESSEPEDELVTVTIYTDSLPQAAAALLLADGRIVQLTGAGSMEIEIARMYVPQGNMQMIPLNDQKMALGIYTADGQVVLLPDPESISEEDAPKSGTPNTGIWAILIWVLIGIGAGAAVLIIYIWKKRGGLRFR